MLAFTSPVDHFTLSGLVAGGGNYLVLEVIEDILFSPYCQSELVYISALQLQGECTPQQ